MGVVRYIVSDINAAIAFYALLGFEQTERWGSAFAIVRRDDLTIWLSGPESSAARRLEDGSAPVSGGWNRIVIQVARLDPLMAMLKKNGAHFRSDPISGPGGKQVLVDDPSGNPVELFEAQS